MITPRLRVDRGQGGDAAFTSRVGVGRERRDRHRWSIAARRWSVAVLLAAISGCGREAAPPPPAFDPDSIPDAYRWSTAALGWPGAARTFQITPAGDLWNGDWKVRIAASAGAVAADSPRVIAYEERWRPVARWARRSGSVRWEFEAVALPEIGKPGPRLSRADLPAPRDSGLIVSLGVRAINLGKEPVEAKLELVIGLGDTLEHFVAFDAPDAPPVPYRWSDDRSSALVEGWSSIPAHGAATAATWTLPPGASRQASFIVPGYPMPSRALATLGKTAHERHAATVRRYWDDEVRASASFELGDLEVENALRAALVLLLTCRERRGPEWVPIGAPFQYRDVWLRDGARAIHALSLLGRTAEARAMARAMLHYQWPPGGFFSQRGQLDGTGQALWAFEQALLRPAPDDSLATIADAATRAWKWCEWMRDLGRRTGWPFGEMLPYSDPRDNEMVRAQLVGTDAWTIAGYRSAARLLRAAGRGAVADTIERTRARYVEEFEAALARTGSPDLPAAWDGAGRDWGNLTVAYPCGVLPAGDPRCVRLARRVWSYSGGPGLASYAHADSAHAYVGVDLGTWALLVGEPESWERVLDATLQWRSASGGASELFSRVTRDYGRNPPPHATAAAGLVALVRNALVFDDTDTLMLTLGGRPAWWKGSHVRGLPSRWGNLDLEFQRRGDEVHWAWSAVPVWTALTLPAGTRLSGPTPAPLVRVSDTRVLAPPGTREATLRVTGVAAVRS